MTLYFEADGVTLHLGDCLKVMAGMEAVSVDAIATDLPYGTTACHWDNVIPFEPMWAGVKHILKPRGVFVTTASQPFTSALVMSNAAWFKYSLVWIKDQITNQQLAKFMPLKNIEDIVVFCQSATTYNPQGIIKTSKHRKPDSSSKNLGHLARSMEYTQNITNYPKFTLYFGTQRGYHPTQKPVALYEYLIRTYTNPGELVADICTGSGTTAIACIRTGRRFVGMELDERYCEIAARRIERELQQPRLFTPDGEPTAEQPHQAELFGDLLDNAENVV